MTFNPTVKAALALALLSALVYTPAFLYTRSLSGVEADRGVVETLPVYGSDSSGFVSLADNWLTHGNFGHERGEHETFRTPGYPFMLALWKSVFGSYTYFPLLQILLVYLTAVLLFSLGRFLFSSPVGAVASVLFLIDPNTIYHALVILSEIPHVFFLTLATYVIIVRPRVFSPEFVSGVLLALSVLIKPVSLYLPLIFALYIVVREAMSGAEFVRRAALSVLLLLLSFSAVLMPWIARNRVVSGVWGVSSVSAFNLFHYTVPEFLSYRDHITPDQGRLRLQNEAPVPLSGYADLAYSAQLTHVALGYIVRDPLHFAEFYAVKTLPFFFSSSLDNFFATYNDIAGAAVFPQKSVNLTNLLLRGDVAGVVHYLRANPVSTTEQIILCALLLLAFIALLGRVRFREITFLFLIVLYFAAVTGPVAYARFRIPASPFLFILASAGFFASMRLLWRKPRAVGAALSPSLSPFTTKPRP